MQLNWETAPADRLDEAWWRSWDELNAAHLGTHPALLSASARVLLRHLAEHPVNGAVLRVDGRIVAQALLERPGRFGLWHLFCPAQSPVGLLVYDPGFREPLRAMRALFRALPGAAVEIVLQRQDPQYCLLEHERSSVLRRSESWTTIALQSRTGFDEYWQQRPKELQDNLRRRLRKAERDGIKLRLARLTAPDEVGAGVDRYGELESRGWKGREGSAVHPSNVQGAFYRDLLMTLAATGNAEVCELYCDDRLAASRLLMRGPSMHIILKTTHDEDMRQYAVGHLQLQLLLRELMASGRTQPVELYTNATRDWLLWSTDTREMKHIGIYRNKLFAGVAELVRRSARLRRPKADGPAGNKPAEATGQ